MNNEQYCNISKNKRIYVICEGSATLDRGVDRVTKRVKMVHETDNKKHALFCKKSFIKQTGNDHCVREYRDGEWYDVY